MLRAYMFLTIITILNGYGQSISGKVVYKILPIDFELKSKSAKINSVMEKMYEEANKQSFTLEFNVMKSSFILNNFLELTNNEDQNKKGISNLASMLVTSDFNYYLDLNTNTVVLEKKDGVLIQKGYKIKKLEITTESKTIGDYLCYKAVYINNYIGRDGKEKNMSIVA
jgi:GLPGLI family protein